MKIKKFIKMCLPYGFVRLMQIQKQKKQNAKDIDIWMDGKGLTNVSLIENETMNYQHELMILEGVKQFRIREGN